MGERLKHWKSTTAGVALSGLVFVLLTSFGCHLPTDWNTWFVTLIPGLIGVFSK